MLKYRQIIDYKRIKDKNTMLTESERTSLILIFERIRPEKFTSAVKLLGDTFSFHYTNDFSMELSGILKRAVAKMQKTENKYISSGL